MGSSSLSGRRRLGASLFEWSRTASLYGSLTWSQAVWFNLMPIRLIKNGLHAFELTIAYNTYSQHIRSCIRLRGFCRPGLRGSDGTPGVAKTETGVMALALTQQQRSIVSATER